MKSVSQQLIDHMHHQNQFNSVRINSIHHGSIKFTIQKKILFYRELVIQDHLQKERMPAKSGDVNHLEKINAVIENYKEKYDSIENGTIIFFIRNWLIYKQEIYLSDIMDFDVKFKEYEKREDNNNEPVKYSDGLNEPSYLEPDDIRC